MGLVVQKFGGTSVATVEHIRRAAELVANLKYNTGNWKNTAEWNDSTCRLKLTYDATQGSKRVEWIVFPKNLNADSIQTNTDLLKARCAGGNKCVWKNEYPDRLNTKNKSTSKNEWLNGHTENGSRDNKLLKELAQKSSTCSSSAG